MVLLNDTISTSTDNLIPEDEVVAHLQFILDDPTPPNPYPITVLTSEHRDKWTNARIQLCNAGKTIFNHCFKSFCFISQFL